MASVDDGRSPFQHSGQLQAVDRRDHVHHVQSSFAGDVPEGTGAVQQRVDFDFGIRQSRPVGVAASSRLASEYELPPLVGVEPGAECRVPSTSRAATLNWRGSA